MPPKKLNIEQLRKRARDLLGAIHANDTRAHQRVARRLPRFGNAEALTKFKYAHALAVIARESGQPSWMQLLRAIEVSERQRQLKQAHSRRIRVLADRIVRKARELDVVGLANIPGIGKADASKVIALISAQPDDLRAVVDAYIAGLSHKNPSVRYECAHALDRYGDPKAVGALIALSYDPVPRVRRMAMHALSCDACKIERPYSDRAIQRAVELAFSDESIQVRRHAVIAVAELAGRNAQPALERLIGTDPDKVVRRNARHMLGLIRRKSARIRAT